MPNYVSHDSALENSTHPEVFSNEQFADVPEVHEQSPENDEIAGQLEMAEMELQQRLGEKMTLTFQQESELVFDVATQAFVGVRTISDEPTETPPLRQFEGLESFGQQLVGHQRLVQLNENNIHQGSVTALTSMEQVGNIVIYHYSTKAFETQETPEADDEIEPLDYINVAPIEPGLAAHWHLDESSSVLSEQPAVSEQVGEVAVEAVTADFIPSEVQAAPIAMIPERQVPVAISLTQGSPDIQEFRTLEIEKPNKEMVSNKIPELRAPEIMPTVEPHTVPIISTGTETLAAVQETQSLPHVSIEQTRVVVSHEATSITITDTAEHTVSAQEVPVIRQEKQELPPTATIEMTMLASEETQSTATPEEVDMSKERIELPATQVDQLGEERLEKVLEEPPIEIHIEPPLIRAVQREEVKSQQEEVRSPEKQLENVVQLEPVAEASSTEVHVELTREEFWQKAERVGAMEISLVEENGVVEASEIFFKLFPEIIQTEAHTTEAATEFFEKVAKSEPGTRAVLIGENGPQFFDRTIVTQVGSYQAAVLELAYFEYVAPESLAPVTIKNKEVPPVALDQKETLHFPSSVIPALQEVNLPQAEMKQQPDALTLNLDEVFLMNVHENHLPHKVSLPRRFPTHIRQTEVISVVNEQVALKENDVLPAQRSQLNMPAAWPDKKVVENTMLPGAPSAANITQEFFIGVSENKRTAPSYDRKRGRSNSPEKEEQRQSLSSTVQALPNLTRDDGTELPSSKLPAASQQSSVN